MQKIVWILFAFCFMACAGSVTNKVAAPETPKVAAVPRAAAPLVPPQAQTEYSYAMSAPEGWQFSEGPNGARAFVHISNETEEMDGVVELYFPPIDGSEPSVVAKNMRAHFEKKGVSCSPDVASGDGSTVSFDMSRSENGSNEAMSGRTIVRRDPVRNGALIQCVGVWATTNHSSLAPQASEICASIEAGQPEGLSEAEPPTTLRLVDVVNAKRPHVTVPAGWLFDERSGRAVKLGADKKPLATCAIRIVPKMDMTVAQHAKVFAGTVTERNDPRVSLRGVPIISPNGARAAVGVTFREAAGAPVKAEGVAIIRAADGLDDGYELCVSNWDPAHPEIQAEAEKLCDSFSVVTTPSTTILEL